MYSHDRKEKISKNLALLVIHSCNPRIIRLPLSKGVDCSSVLSNSSRVNRFIVQSILINGGRFWTISPEKKSSKVLVWSRFSSSFEDLGDYALEPSWLFPSFPSLFPLTPIVAYNLEQTLGKVYFSITNENTRFFYRNQMFVFCCYLY